MSCGWSFMFCLFPGYAVGTATRSTARVWCPAGRRSCLLSNPAAGSPLAQAFSARVKCPACHGSRCCWCKITLNVLSRCFWPHVGAQKVGCRGVAVPRVPRVAVAGSSVRVPLMLDFTTSTYSLICKWVANDTVPNIWRGHVPLAFNYRRKELYSHWLCPQRICGQICWLIFEMYIHCLEVNVSLLEFLYNWNTMKSCSSWSVVIHEVL